MNRNEKGQFSGAARMSEEDLYSGDNRAIHELKELYIYFCQASDIHLENCNVISDRGHRASVQALSQAYGWASSSVADSIRRLGHEVPVVKK